MSNYQRNTNMVVCIFVVLVGGAVITGLLSYYGTANWNWTRATTEYAFEAEVGATTGTVTLDIDLNAGGVTLTFVDNATLLYDIDIEVENNTVATDGEPTVTFASNTIGLDYTAAGVNITLGTGVNYTIDINAEAGGVSIDLDNGAHIGDVTVQSTAGGISFKMSDNVILVGSPTFDFEELAGGISFLIDLPPNVGGSFECTAGLGGVDITAAGWTEVTSTHYETSDYDTAPQSLTITAHTSAGGISATLT
ncbi:MAG: hypothetical protein ACFFF9_09260 [Candidatus Thorarchaeota archaeon]